MDTRKLRERFEIVQSLETNSVHPSIDKVRKKRPRGNLHPKYDSLWYMKREPKCKRPVCEVIGQELFRLLLPHQPKTRLMLRRDIYGQRDQIYILSKEIPAYKPFSDIDSAELLTNILNGQYIGFGEVLVAALFVQENDLHSGNIGVDENGRVVKIDGGHIFCSSKQITAEDIAALPMLSGTYPVNWIGISSWKRRLKRSDIDLQAVLASKAINELPAFRREVNQMLLKICLLPDELIKRMVFSYGAEEAEVKNITNLLLANKQVMLIAALANPDFIRYVVSAEAQEDLKNYFSYLEQFKTTGKHYLLRDDEMDLGFVEVMAAQFIEMHKVIEAQNGESILVEIGRLFGLIPPPEADESIAQRLRNRP